MSRGAKDTHMGKAPERGRPARGRRWFLFAGYVVALVAVTVYVLLDAFVIERSYAAVGAMADATVKSSAGAVQEVSSSGEAAGEASAKTSVSHTRYLDTEVYVVDVYAQDARSLLAAFAKDTYGKNVTESTSEMAEAHGATVAINGDYYGARNDGYVIRNGVLYRDTVAAADQEDLVIYANGTFEVIREGDVSAQELVDAGAWQVFSFGPGLVRDGSVDVSEDEEVGRAKASNPRTAIGKVDDGHYVFVVSDGRTDESEGLSLSQLATFMVAELGVECAYNMDGGGSSTLWYEGEVVNNPTTSGNSIKERSVSDIVYIVS